MKIFNQLLVLALPLLLSNFLFAQSCIPPNDVTLSFNGDGTATASWSPVTNSTYYQILYRVKNSNMSWYNTYGPNTSLVLPVLIEDEEYEYKIRSYCSGWKAFGSLTYFTVPSNNGSAQCVNPEPTVTINPDGTVTMNWFAVSGATNYQMIYRVKGGGTGWTYKTGPEITVQLTDIQSDKLYEYYVRSHCSFGWLTWSNYNLFSTSSSAPNCENSNGLNFPIDEKITFNGNGTAEMTWSPVAGGTYYLIYHKLKNGFTWSSTSVPNPNGSLLNLIPGEKYEYKLRTRCGSTWKPIGPIKTFTVPNNNGINDCTRPSETIQYDYENNTVTLEWDAPSGADYYQMLYRKKAVGGFTYLTHPSTFRVLENIEREVEYEYYLRSRCQGMGWHPIGEKKSFILVEPQELQSPGTQYAVINTLDPTTTCNGQIEIEVNEENGPHSFLWSNGATTQNVSALCSGNYSVTITDADGCDLELTAQLTGAVGCNVSLGNFNVLIQGYCNERLGQITLNNTTEIQYSYAWSNGSKSHQITNLAGGEYCVTISSLSNESCSEEYCFTVAQDKDCSTLCEIDSRNFSAEIQDYCVKEYGHIKMTNYTKTDYIYTWSVGDAGGPNLVQLTPGTYCVTISDPSIKDCSITFCFDINRVDACRAKIISRDEIGKYLVEQADPRITITPLMVNEFSNGEDKNSEYVELLVLGNEECTPVDIRGFIIDDNSGVFSKEKVGSGIAPGHLRFPSKKEWSKIPPGSLIVVYNELNKNTSIGDDDLNDENKDGVYIISASELEANISSPNFTDLDYYNTTGEYTSGEWSYLWMYKQGDAIQVRYPDGKYCHGFAYGHPSKIHGGPDNLLIEAKDGIGKIYFFNQGDIKNVNNYQVGEIANNNQTPGMPNTKDNAEFINTQCERSEEAQTYKEELTAQVSPNPFSNNILLEIELPEAQELEFQMYDILGRRILTRIENLNEGNHRIEFDTSDDKFNQGVYYLVVLSGETQVYQQKMICIK